jgi:hypothetical protein
MDTSKELSLPEYRKLRELFDECSYADPDDTQLFEAGNHRNLYDYITSGLRMTCAAGRGPAYHFASDLLKENREYRVRFVLDVIAAYHPQGSAREWAKYLMGAGV